MKKIIIPFLLFTFLLTFVQIGNGQCWSKLRSDVAGSQELLDYFHSLPKADRLKAWHAIGKDADLSKVPSNLIKVDNYSNDFAKTYDDIKVEFDNLPASQRQGWIDHLEFRTSGNRVNKSLNKPELHSSWSDTDVPNHYKSHTNSAGEDFNSLAADPVDGIVPKTRQEAMAGIECVNQSLIQSPLKRGPVEIEFYDGNGSPWDVKTPNGKFPIQIPDGIGKSIKSQLRNKPAASPGQFTNSLTQELEDIKIILDNSYISTSQRQEIWDWLNSSQVIDGVTYPPLSLDELDRIIEVNIRL